MDIIFPGAAFWNRFITAHEFQHSVGHHIDTGHHAGADVTGELNEAMGKAAAVAVSKEDQRECGILLPEPAVKKQQVLHRIHGRLPFTVAGTIVGIAMA